MQLKHQTLGEAMQRVVGKALLSVDFVHDYVQLEWEGSFFTAYIMPKAYQGSVEYCCDDPEYRNVMYRLEGQVLRDVDVVLDEEIRFRFSNSTVLSVSLRHADYVGPEAVQFGGPDGPLWVV